MRWCQTSSSVSLQISCVMVHKFVVNCVVSCFVLYLVSFPLPLKCLSPSLCQYRLLHAFSSVSSPHYLTCPPPCSLPTCSSFPNQCVCVLKPWFTIYSLSVHCWCLCDAPLAFLVFLLVSLVLVCFGFSFATLFFFPFLLVCV